MKTLLINGEILEHTSSLEWSDDLDTVANTISFTTDTQIAIGSKFVLMDKSTAVLSGIISEYTQNEPNKFQYSGYDFGFYLNKNAVLKQFNGMAISDAFTKLCNDFSIPVGQIPTMSATVKKIYKNVILSEVFKEFLDLNKSKTGQDYYYFTCADGKFNIKKYELNEDLQGYIGEAFSIISTDSLTSPSISVSMEDLKNKIIVTDNANDKISKQISLSDSASISQYGLLQHVEQVDTDINNDFNAVARSKLAELNQLKTTIDITMLGDWNMHKGVVMPIEDYNLSLSGDYLIKSSRHSITGNKEVVSCNLIKYDRSKL